MIKIILLSDFEEQYGKDLLRGITRYSKDHGAWTFCRMPTHYRETLGMEVILSWAREWEADGVIGLFENSDEAKIFTQAGIPVIAQDFKERLSGIPSITGGYRETGRLGAEYFLKKGFKHFAFYGFNNIVWSRERALGFGERVREAGYDVHYYEHKDSRSMLWYYKPSELSRWLNALPKPICLMTCDDNQGHHITEACRHVGIRIPEEVAVLGVDNDEMICDLSDPPLSSIALDVEKGGYDAAKLLDHMIQHGTKHFYDVVVRPTQVITRHSTDIYATNDDHIASSLKYIHQNIDKNLHVDEVVKQVPLSRRALEKRFLEITGYPIYKYIFNLRIEKFTQKLLDTDMSVFEIALDMGLGDSKNIARQFRQAKGCSPSAYRNKYVAGK